MDDDISGEPLFRANKRRKVFRKRASSDAHDAAPDVVSDPAAPVVGADALYDGEESYGSTGIVRLQKKTVAKKAGIAFTSSDAIRQGEEENEERAMVLAEDDSTPAAIQGDRFVKPTGRVAVADNKHMVAYIDSKLAEMRPLISTPLDEANNHGSEDLMLEAQSVMNRSGERNTASAAPTAKAPTTLDSAQSRNTRVYQRPSKRRQPPQREQKDVARDSIIDQIMQESQVPLYDRSGSHTPAADNVDNDAATAEAFKAQLLVEMEEQNRRRPAPRNPAVKDGSASMQSGPKLGGSRAQREKMRALEEAKTKGSPAKK